MHAIDKDAALVVAVEGQSKVMPYVISAVPRTAYRVGANQTTLPTSHQPLVAPGDMAYYWHRDEQTQTIKNGVLMLGA